MGPIRCSETLVNNYHSTRRNIPDERRSHQRRGGNLKLKQKKYYFYGETSNCLSSATCFGTAWAPIMEWQQVQREVCRGTVLGTNKPVMRVECERSLITCCKTGRVCVNITLRRVRVSIVAVDKLYVLHILSVCLCLTFYNCNNIFWTQYIVRYLKTGLGGTIILKWTLNKSIGRHGLDLCGSA
jgi:hypothetical protein